MGFEHFKLFLFCFSAFIFISYQFKAKASNFNNQKAKHQAHQIKPLTHDAVIREFVFSWKSSFKSDWNVKHEIRYETLPTVKREMSESKMNENKNRVYILSQFLFKNKSS